MAIEKHKVVKGGQTPPQLQFLVRWQDGYTTNKHLGSVIHKHPTEIGLYFIKYKPSWEPYNNYAITHLIPPYKVEQKISGFGDPFDQEIKDLIPKNFDHDAIQTYKFQYEERANAPEDTNVEDPPGRKKGADPRTAQNQQRSRCQLKAVRSAAVHGTVVRTSTSPLVKKFAKSLNS
jgi:hypothetical protein